MSVNMKSRVSSVRRTTGIAAAGRLRNVRSNLVTEHAVVTCRMKKKSICHERERESSNFFLKDSLIAEYINVRKSRTEMSRETARLKIMLEEKLSADYGQFGFSASDLRSKCSETEFFGHSSRETIRHVFARSTDACFHAGRRFRPRCCLVTWRQMPRSLIAADLGVAM